MSTSRVERRRDPNDDVGTWVANSTHGGGAVALSGTIKYGPGKHGVSFVLDQEWLDGYVRAREACSQAMESPGHAVWHMDSQRWGPCEGARRYGHLPAPEAADEPADFVSWARLAPGLTDDPAVRAALLSCWEAARWSLLRAIGKLTVDELDALRRGAEERKLP